MKTKMMSVVLLLALTTQVGCVKDLLKKKETPEEKFSGTWNATQIAVDLNGNNAVDANELRPFSGSSTLKVLSDQKFTYQLSAGGSTVSMAGNWALSSDEQSFTITDPIEGSIRFDSRTETEIQTEPISTGTSTGWFIYKKQ